MKLNKRQIEVLANSLAKEIIENKRALAEKDADSFIKKYSKQIQEMQDWYDNASDMHEKLCKSGEFNVYFGPKKDFKDDIKNAVISKKIPYIYTLTKEIEDLITLRSIDSADLTSLKINIKKDYDKK